MGNALLNVTLSGTTSIVSGGYITKGAFGGPKSAAGAATSTNHAYFASAVEIDGVLYIDGNIATGGSRQWKMGTGNATAITLWDGTVNMYRLDTSAYRNRFYRTVVVSSGIINNGSGTGAVRQPEMYKFALGSGDAAGGIINASNPLGVNCIVGLADVNITAAGQSGTMDIGVSSAASTHDNVFDGVSVATARCLDNIRCGGTSGLTGVLLGSTEYITASRATGTMSGLDGYAYFWLIPR